MVPRGRAILEDAQSILERIVWGSRRPVLVAYDCGVSAVRFVARWRNPVFSGLAGHVFTVGPDTPEVHKELDAAKVRLEAAGIAATTSCVPVQQEAVLRRMVDDAQFYMGTNGHSRILHLLGGPRPSK